MLERQTSCHRMNELVSTCKFVGQFLVIVWIRQSIEKVAFTAKSKLVENFEPSSEYFVKPR